MTSADAAAEREFEAHDWVGDEAWNDLLGRLEVPAHVDKELVLQRRKRKYFQIKYNSDLLLDGPPQESLRSSSQSSSNLSTNDGTRRRKIIMLNYARMAMHSFVMLFAVGFIVMPFLVSVAAAFFCFRYALLTTAAVNLLDVVERCGAPKLKKEYWKTVMLQESTHTLLISLVLVTAKPQVFLLLPVVANSLLFVAVALDKAILPMRAPQLHQKLTGKLKQVEQSRNVIVVWAATVELINWFILIIGIFTGSSSILLAIMYGQFMRMRYILSPSSKQACSNIKQTLDTYLMSPSCPRLITTVYVKITNFLYSFVDLGRMQQQQQGEGIFSKCTIM